jgi:outer membrane protein assembly factor BamC
MTPYGKPCGKLILLCDIMKNRIGIVLIVTVTVVLTGCSYVQSLFPDKERDYQYTAEIPLINYPAELRENQSTNGASDVTPSVANSEGSETGTTAINTEQPAANNASSENAAEPTPSATPDAVSSTPVTPADEADGQDAISSVEIIKYDDGESRLRLGAGYSKTWRAVNKALSHKTIEVTERNHDKAQIVVQYDPDEKRAKDEGFMDEITFIFHGINTNEKEYVLKLEQHDQQTDVIVLNEEHLPLLNDDAALRLLKVLADTIKADLADKAK